MRLAGIVSQVAGGVLVLHLIAMLLIVGPSRLRSAFRNGRSNLRAVAPALAVLVFVLGINGVVRDIGVEISWIIGFNITGYIHAAEGRFVAHVQSVSTPPLTAYFGFVYVFGYTFLLTFPIAAYLIHDDPKSLHETIVAYIVNYGVGLLCYVMFVSYGPRNFMPELVEPLLYTSWPQSQLLTRQVNANTNVFPSLHTSLSVTVAIIAYRFRNVYSRWFPIAGVVAVSIVVSTMYLGIHWMTDVLAGILVAVMSVVLAARVSGSTNDDRGPGLSLNWGHRWIKHALRWRQNR